MPRFGIRVDLRVSVVDLRQAAQAAVDAESLRGVAAAIGMSPPGLQHFLRGGLPLRPTLRKLAAWYTGRAHRQHHVTEEALYAALALLLDDLPAVERQGAARELMRVLRRHYGKVRVEPPSWTYTLAGDEEEAAERTSSSVEGTDRARGRE